MKRILGTTLTPSFSISVLALTVALGGGAAWAGKLVASPAVTVRCFSIRTFQNGWKNVPDSGFHKVEVCKDSLGYVHLDGVLTGGRAPAVAFRLPRSDRPRFNHAFAVAAGIGTPAPIDLDVGSNGDVFVNAAVNDEVSLDGVTFHLG